MTEKNYSQEITKNRNDLVGYEQQANDFICETEENNIKAGEVIKWLSKFKKEVDTRRKFFKAPSMEAVRRIDGEFQPIIKKAASIIEILKSKVGVYLLKKERIERARIQKELIEAEKKRLEEIRIIEEKAKEEKELQEIAGIENTTHDVEVAQKIASIEVAPIEEVNLKTESTSARKVYDFDVIDISLLPKEYILPNLSLIKKAINGKGRKEQISGIKIKEKMLVRIK